MDHASPRMDNLEKEFLLCTLHMAKFVAFNFLLQDFK